MTRPNLVDTKVMALALGVTEAAVRKMRERGHLTRYGSPQRAQWDLREAAKIVRGRGDTPTRRQGR